MMAKSVNCGACSKQRECNTTKRISLQTTEQALLNVLHLAECSIVSSDTSFAVFSFILDSFSFLPNIAAER